MTKEQFENYKFSVNTEVLCKIYGFCHWHKIFWVDFKRNEVRINEHFIDIKDILDIRN
jgi:hypothetical protein